MNPYHDRYSRFGAFISVFIGVVVIAIAGLMSSCHTYPGWRGQERLEQEQEYPVIRPMDTCELSENGYIGWSNESRDWCDQFFNFDHDDISISGQVGDDYIVIFLRDMNTGVMSRIAGDNVSSLKVETK